MPTTLITLDNPVQVNIAEPATPITGASGERYALFAERFKLLAHPERLRILDVLRRGDECVCHLEALLHKPQPYVSQQLRVLRQAGVIVDEKRGNNVYYRLCDPEIEAWLAATLGPVADEDAELAFFKATIACPCPKCDDGDEAAAPSPPA